MLRCSGQQDEEKRSDRGLIVLEHLTGLLIGAPLLQTLPLEISHLELLQPACVVPPGPYQDVVSLIWVQKDYQTQDQEFHHIFGWSKTLSGRLFVR